MRTPIRRLEGITYWVIEDPEAIRDFINNEIRREWEADARSERRDPRGDPWLKTLSKRTWTLRTARMNQIKLDPRIMNYTDVKSGYVFVDSLAKRSQELREAIDGYALVIWPVIVKKENFMLVDGYCRYNTLKAMNVSRIFAYLGAL